MCIGIYRTHSRNTRGEIWEDAYKVSFADFWSSVDLQHFTIDFKKLKNVSGRLHIGKTLKNK